MRARLDMVNDLTEDGLGCETCALKNERLIVRAIRREGVYAVSHEGITDRSFIAREHELDPWDGVWDQPKATPA